MSKKSNPDKNTIENPHQLREETLAQNLFDAGDILKTSKKTGVPSETIQQWKQKYNHSILATIRFQRFMEFINNAWDLAQKALEKMEQDLPNASTRDTVAIFNSSIGKLLECASLFTVEREATIEHRWTSPDQIDEKIQELKNEMNNKIQELKALESPKNSD